MKRILTYKIDPYDNGNMHLGFVSRNDTVYLNIDIESLEKDANDITIKVLGKKSNGKLIEQKDNDNITKEENTINIKLKEVFVSTDGIVNLNIYLKDDEGAVTYIAPYFYVNSTIEGDIVEDKDTIDTLEEIKREAEQLIKKVDDKLNEITSGGGRGKTWRPSVSEDGLLSWSEDNSDTPPESVNIKGEPGRDGKVGPQGIPGLNGRDGEQGPPGENGITPHIGDNGNWFLGNEDTGKPSRGESGQGSGYKKIASVVYNGNTEIHPVSLDKETGIFTCAEPHNLPSCGNTSAIIGYSKGVGQDFGFNCIPYDIQKNLNSLGLRSQDKYSFKVNKRKEPNVFATINSYECECDLSKFHFEIPSSTIRLDLGGEYKKIKLKIKFFGYTTRVYVSFSGIPLARVNNNDDSMFMFATALNDEYGHHNIEIEADTTGEVTTFVSKVTSLIMRTTGSSMNLEDDKSQVRKAYSYKGKPISYIEFKIDTRYGYITNGAQIDIYGERGGE